MKKSAITAIVLIAGLGALMFALHFLDMGELIRRVHGR